MSLRIPFLVATLVSLSFSAGATLVPGNESHLTNDPFFSYQWALKESGQTILREVDDLNSEPIRKLPGSGPVDLGWSKLTLSRPVTVAVIDSGADVNHEDLRDNLFRNKIECDADGNIPFRPTEDKDRNGYVGDCIGWNFVAKEGPGTNNPEDDVGHGTHIAGIMAARTGNGVGIAGVSDQIRILPIRVYSEKDQYSDAFLKALNTRVIRAIDYAILMKAEVINFSLGWPSSVDTPELRQAFVRAQQAGVVVVAAAGNNSSSAMVFPCAYESVICVGAQSLNGQAAPFSNFGGHIDVWAPGEEILSLQPTALEPLAFSVKGYEILSGTSQAAPYVSAVAAILKSQGLSMAQVRARLQMTAALNGGFVSLAQAMANTNMDLVRPVFKDQQVVEYSPQSRLFQLPLKLENLGNTAIQANVEVQLQSTGMQLDKKSYSVSLRAMGTTALSISGRVLNENAESRVPVSVKISSSSRATRSFEQTYFFMRRTEENSKVRDWPVRLTQVPESFEPATIRTLSPVVTAPEYSNIEKTQDGFAVRILRFVGSELREVGRIPAPRAKSVLLILRADWNGDNQLDYLVMTERTKTMADGKVQRQLVYTYVDAQLRPLFGTADIDVTPEGAILQSGALPSLNLLPLQVEGLGTFRTLVFAEVGVAPKADRNPDPLEFEPLEQRLRLYYMEPKFENGQLRLLTRNFDNYGFTEAARKQLQVPFRESLKLSALLPQTSEDLRNGELNALLSIGASTQKTHRLLKIRGDQLQHRAFSIESLSLSGLTLEGAQLTNSIRMTGSQWDPASQPVATSFYSPVSARTLWLQNNAIRSQTMASPERAQDQFVGFVKAYEDNQNSYAFYQTKTHLALKVTGFAGERYFEKTIDRSSLMPGGVFNSTIEPIVVGTSQKTPGIFVDTTKLFSRRLFSWVATSAGLSDPLRLTASVPAGCRTMAPQVLPGSQGYSYILLCGASRGNWTLRGIPVD